MSSGRALVRAFGDAVAVAARSCWATLAELLETEKVVNNFPVGGTADAKSRRGVARHGCGSHARNAAVMEDKPDAAGRIGYESHRSRWGVNTFEPIFAHGHLPAKLREAELWPDADFVPALTVAMMTHYLGVESAIQISVTCAKSFPAWMKFHLKEANFDTPSANCKSHVAGAAWN